jgi:hypothetical protein
MNGIERIAAERRRQIEEEGWDQNHDAQHTDDSLAMAACYYALPDSFDDELTADSIWPTSWAQAWRKKFNKNRVRQLEIAGALIAAEIDRLILAAGGSIKIVKITLWDGATYYSDKYNDDYLSAFFRRAHQLYDNKNRKRTQDAYCELIEMTKEEYHAIPATNESAELFGI